MQEGFNQLLHASPARVSAASETLEDETVIIPTDVRTKQVPQHGLLDSPTADRLYEKLQERDRAMRSAPFREMPFLLSSYQHDPKYLRNLEAEIRDFVRRANTKTDKNLRKDVEK